MLVRLANLEDAQTIADFNQAMALETEDLHLPDQQILDGVTNLIHHPDRGYYLVVEHDQRVVGCLGITFEWSDWRNGQFLWIQSVYIHPDSRRLGAFKAMHDVVIDKAKRDPLVCGVRLYVENHNDRARSTYFALGMSKTHYDLLEIEV